jgi:hypothetical protein
LLIRNYVERVVALEIQKANRGGAGGGAKRVGILEGGKNKKKRKFAAFKRESDGN